jgi:hypothetical protein
VESLGRGETASGRHGERAKGRKGVSALGRTREGIVIEWDLWAASIGSISPIRLQLPARVTWPKVLSPFRRFAVSPFRPLAHSRR